MDDANLEDLERELGEKRDMLLVHALVHYMHDGHSYVLAMRSANAIPWLERGQYLLAVRLDDSSKFWRLRDELARLSGKPAGYSTATDSR